MSNVEAKVLKRRKYPVTIGEGDDAQTFYVRALSIADRRRLDGIEDILSKVFFGIGRGLLDDDGTEAYPRQDGESDADYAARVMHALEEIPTDTLNELSDAIDKIGIVPKDKVIAKN